MHFLKQEIDKISSLGAGELLSVLATHKIIQEEIFQCEKCLNKKATEAAIQRIREAQGCFGKSARAYNLESFKLSSCVGNFYSPAAFFWYRNFRNFQKGILPFAGTLLEQPAKAIEIFQIFESLDAKQAIEADRQAKIEQRNKK